MAATLKLTTPSPLWFWPLYATGSTSEPTFGHRTR
jgi:hypothetical protein